MFKINKNYLVKLLTFNRMKFRESQAEEPLVNIHDGSEQLHLVSVRNGVQMICLEKSYAVDERQFFNQLVIVAFVCYCDVAQHRFVQRHQNCFQLVHAHERFVVVRPFQFDQLANATVSSQLVVWWRSALLQIC